MVITRVLLRRSWNILSIEPPLGLELSPILSPNGFRGICIIQGRGERRAFADGEFVDQLAGCGPDGSGEREYVVFESLMRAEKFDSA
jgi:hypothetical protein